MTDPGPPPDRSASTVDAPVRQRILVLQQQRRGESKTAGIRRYGNGVFDVDVVSIDADLPPVVDDATEYLPPTIQADLVLDFLKHPDLSHDLAALCRTRNIPIIASGKKMRIPGVLTPPT